MEHWLRQSRSSRNRPRIAVSIAARTAKDAARMIQTAKRLGGDIAEIRLDFLEREGSLRRIVQAGNLPLIAAYRSSPGRSHPSEAKRLEVLFSAAEAGFDYVDVGLETTGLVAVLDKLHNLGVETIVSHHDFEKTASRTQLNRILHKCRRFDTILTKLVTTATTLEDNLRLLSFTQEASRDGALICFGMGKLGIHSRVFSPIYGASFTFASLDENTATASGQLSVETMRKIYRMMGYS